RRARRARGPPAPARPRARTSAGRGRCGRAGGGEGSAEPRSAGGANGAGPGRRGRDRARVPGRRSAAPGDDRPALRPVAPRALEDALALVAARARLFERLPPSAMLSVGLSEEDVTPLLDPGVSLAAVNAPSQCVVSGNVDAIESLHERLAELGVRVRRLRLSTAGHSSLVDAIVDEFAEATCGISVERPSV